MMFNKDSFKRYFANTSWLLGERLSRMAINFIVSIYVARYLGPDDFGLLSYVISFSGLFLAVATLGLDGILVGDLTTKRKQKGEILGTAFILRLIASLLSILLILLFATKVIHHERIEVIFILIISFGYFFNAYSVIDLYFQSIVKSKYVVPALLFQSIVSGSLKLLFVFIEAPLLWFVWVILLDAIILAVGLILIYWSQGFFIRSWSFSLRLSKSLLYRSWPLIISGLMISLYMKIDQVMLKHLFSENAVGQYAVAVRLVEVWYFIPMTIASSLFPAIVAAKESGDSIHYQKRIQQFYTVMIWLGIIISIPTSLLAPYIIDVLYGGQYIVAGDVLRLYIWATMFVFFGVARSKWVIVENQQIYTMIYLTGGAVINVTFNYILIPAHGTMGATYATLLSLFSSIILIPIFINTLQRKQVIMFFSALMNPFSIFKKSE